MFYTAIPKETSKKYHMYVLKIFLKAHTVHDQQNIFEKTLIKVIGPHFHTSFGTFCF